IKKCRIEDELGRRMDFVLDAINTDHIYISFHSLDMLHSLGINGILGITQVTHIYKLPFPELTFSVGVESREERRRSWWCKKGTFSKKRRSSQCSKHPSSSTVMASLSTIARANSSSAPTPKVPSHVTRTSLFSWIPMVVLFSPSVERYNFFPFLLVFNVAKELVAQIRRKVDPATSVMLGKEVFWLCIKPAFDAAFERWGIKVFLNLLDQSWTLRLFFFVVDKNGNGGFAEFLSATEKNGKSIAVSFYEVLVKSIAEFQNLYSYACFALKGAPKKGGCEHVRRSHMGLIVHVFSQNGSLVSKVNFVDLAGYEDARKKSSDGSYLAEIKNYTHATGFVKNPSFCQDTIYMVSLASWSCHWICRAFLDSTKRNASSAKQMVNSHKN
ncbi:hypothetical protein D0Y65_045936, partial [Glycine soja]